MRATRVAGWCGVVGPVAFTAAWLLAARRQDGYEVRHEHISGLAAKDAVDAGIMTGGFAALGACTIAFAWALERRLAPRPGAGPALLGVAGVATLAAGVFRRDRRSNLPLPGEDAAIQSLENDLHDVAATAIAVSGATALVSLARRLAADPSLADLARPAAMAALTGSGLSAWFLRDVVRPWNGIVQRASVTIPLAFIARLALRIATEPR